MKKLVIFLISLVLILGIASADEFDEFRQLVSSATDEELTEARETYVQALEIIDQEIAKRNSSNANDGILLQRDFGDYEVKLVSLSLKKEYNRNVLIVELSFTNKSNTKQKFLTSASVDVYQNGVELSTAYLVDGVDTSVTLADVKGGATVTIYEAYEINDLKTPLEIEISKWISYNDTPVSGTFPVPTK